MPFLRYAVSISLLAGGCSVEAPNKDASKEKQVSAESKDLALTSGALLSNAVISYHIDVRGASVPSKCALNGTESTPVTPAVLPSGITPAMTLAFKQKLKDRVLQKFKDCDRKASKPKIIDVVVDSFNFSKNYVSLSEICQAASLPRWGQTCSPVPNKPNSYVLQLQKSYSVPFYYTVSSLEAGCTLTTNNRLVFAIPEVIPPFDLPDGGIREQYAINGDYTVKNFSLTLTCSFVDKETLSETAYFEVIP